MRLLSETVHFLYYPGRSSKSRASFDGQEEEGTVSWSACCRQNQNLVQAYC
jgi:hypothetical protein